MFTLLTCP